MIEGNNRPTENASTEEQLSTIDTALATALENATDERLKEHIRRARQRVLLLEDDSTFVCELCEERVSSSERREYLPPESDFTPASEDVETTSLCLECSTKKPHRRVFQPREVLEGSE